MDKGNNSNSILDLIQLIADFFWFWTRIGFWVYAFLFPILITLVIVRPAWILDQSFGEKTYDVNKWQIAVFVVLAILTYFYIFLGRRYIGSQPSYKYAYLWLVWASVYYCSLNLAKSQTNTAMASMQPSRIAITLADARSGKKLLPGFGMPGADIKNLPIGMRGRGVDPNTMEFLWASVNAVKITCDSNGYKSKEITCDPGTDETITIALEPNTPAKIK
jgi:hypothetical protein